MDAFLAGWKASKGLRERSADPTLYASERVFRRLPIKFSSGLPKTLWVLLVFNVLFLMTALEGTVMELLIQEPYYQGLPRAVRLVLMNCFFPIVLLIQSSVDLHKRRKLRLGPKRVVASAGVALALLITAFSLWSSCYIGIQWNLQLGCPNDYYEFYDFHMYYSWAAIDFSPYLPFMAFLNVIFYSVYLAFGWVALVRDYQTAPNMGSLRRFSWEDAGKPTPVATPKSRPRWQLWSMKSAVTHASSKHSVSVPEEIHPKYAEDRPPSHVTSIELADLERASSGDETLTQHSSLWDSSIAEVSEHTDATISSSTEESSSLVTPYSVRSSAVISISSCDLPPYSERGSNARSRRDSADLELACGRLSHPQQVYLTP